MSGRTEPSAPDLLTSNRGADREMRVCAGPDRRQGVEHLFCEPASHANVAKSSSHAAFSLFPRTSDSCTMSNIARSVMSLILFSLGSAQCAEAVRSCSQRSARRRVQRPGLRAGPPNPELNLMGEIGVGMEVGGGFDVRLRRSEFVLPCFLRAANYGHVPMGIALKDSHSLLMASAPCARGHLGYSSCMKPAHGKMYMPIMASATVPTGAQSTNRHGIPPPSQSLQELQTCTVHSPSMYGSEDAASTQIYIRVSYARTLRETASS